MCFFMKASFDGVSLLVSDPPNGNSISDIVIYPLREGLKKHVFYPHLLKRGGRGSANVDKQEGGEGA